MWMILFVVVLVAAALVYKGFKAQVGEDERLAEEFPRYDLYISAVDQSLIGVSFEKKMIALGFQRAAKKYAFSQIASVEVVENGVTITNHNRGSQALGAVAGGFIMPGIGAVVGGLTGSSRTVSHLRGLSLKVTVDDRVQPVYAICFLKVADKKGLSEDNPIVKTARAKIECFHAHLANAMREVQIARAGHPAQNVSGVGHPPMNGAPGRL